MTDIQLTKITETNTTITLGWTPPFGIQWYLFYANGRTSNAAPIDKNGVVKNSIKFSKNAEANYKVVAICRQGDVFSVDVGTYTVASPPLPPPSSPIPPSNTTLVFPGVTAGPVNTFLPTRGAADSEPDSKASSLGDFNRMDYEGWLNKNQQRMKWVLDPVDNSKIVASFECKGTDSADQYGGCRTSIWKTPADNIHGTESWCSWKFFLPINFVWPDQWLLLYQMFSSGGNPAQAIELRPGTNSSKRDQLWWKCQTQPTSGQNYFDLGPATTGVWHHILTNTKYSSDNSGFCFVWHEVNSKPNALKAPTVEWHGKTLYDLTPGRENIMIYRGASNAPDQIQTVLFGEFLRWN